MGAERAAHVWCDGPADQHGFCVTGGQNEYGDTIGQVRADLKAAGWVVRRRDGETVDMCGECKEVR
jgi:hypothetical protein